MKIRFAAGVGDEITAIAEYIEKKRSGYGGYFLDDIREELDAIRQFPQMHQAVRRNYRRVSLKRWKHHLFYRLIDDRTILVVRVIHSARSPERWPQLNRPGNPGDQIS